MIKRIWEYIKGLFSKPAQKRTITKSYPLPRFKRRRKHHSQSVHSLAMERKRKDPRPRMKRVVSGVPIELQRNVKHTALEPDKTPRKDGKPNCMSCGHNAFKTIRQVVNVRQNTTKAIKEREVACRYCGEVRWVA